jgi:5-methylcytosine-specific restriction endonuclease McrA
MGIRTLCFFLLFLGTAVQAASHQPGEDDSLRLQWAPATLVEERGTHGEFEGRDAPGGLAGNRKAGKAFTKKQKTVVKEQNAAANDGKNHCEDCGVETVPAKKHEKGVTPPKNETHVDHKVPRVKGGPAEVDNAQVLCRDCNLKKGSKEPAQEPVP